MRLLEFAIPTWHRPEKLSISVCSIAEQGGHVVISHHLCDLETMAVVEKLKKKYPKLVRAVACELGTSPDYSESFKQLFSLPEAKYTWTFGDDDVLVPGAIEAITPILERDEFDFIHCAEVVRSASTGSLIKGKLIELCNAIGWIDMTGFISCNIIRTTKLNEACQLKSWPLYATNAFVQSCALLEVLYDSECAFLDTPLVDSKVQYDEEATSTRWSESNVGLRYHYVDDALLDMKKRGIIKTNLTPKFFRYIEYHLWDRFIGHIVNSYNSDQDFQLTDYLDNLLVRCYNLVTFLDPMNRKRYADEITEVRQSMIEHSGALQYAIKKAGVMGRLVDNHSRSHYEYGYLRKTPAKQSPRG